MKFELSSNSAAVRVRRAEAKLKEQGWQRKHIWLSPECIAALADLMRTANTNEARGIIEKIIIDAAKNIK